MENIHISKIITISVGETPTDSINTTKKSEAFPTGWCLTKLVISVGETPTDSIIKQKNPKQWLRIFYINTTEKLFDHTQLFTYFGKGCNGFV
jgi:hypothetical protein